MVLQTFVGKFVNLETTEIRIRLLGKTYAGRNDCEFIYYGDREKDYELGYWNGYQDKKMPNGTPWKYANFEFLSSFDSDSIIVYVSEQPRTVFNGSDNQYIRPYKNRYDKGEKYHYQKRNYDNYE